MSDRVINPDFKELLKDGYFDDNLDDAQLIASGGFSTVVKVNCKTDQTVTAIKMIALNENDTNALLKQMREIRVNQNLHQRNCVKLIHYWIENNKTSSDRFYRFKNERTISDNRLPMNSINNEQDAPILHLQMKYYPLNLKEVINQIRGDKGVDQLLSIRLYSIASKLLIVIVESLNSLHNNDPPIIHRDIKPENILLGCDLRPMISDFGLSVELRTGSQRLTGGVGTGKYMASEVKQGRTYGPPADIYGLAVLIQELFNFDVDTTKYRGNPEFSNQYEILSKLVASMMNPLAQQRPTCEEILNMRQEWAVELNSVRPELLNLIDPDAHYSLETQFVEYFIQNELNQ